MPDNGYEWIEPSLLNGWYNRTDDPYPPISFTKDAMGFIHIRGCVRGGTYANNTIIFTLPEGYRTGYYETFVVSGNSSTQTAVISIRTDGTVRVFYLTGNSFLHFSGITFFAEN